MKINSNSLTKGREINYVPVLSLLLIQLLVPILISCGDFVDEKAPETPPVVQPPVQHPQTPQTPQTPETPKPQTPTETEAQRNWRLCEAERIWAFNARIIDVGALRLYQSRNFAPVFNHPGERQSGIEGWYGCKHALELNGFIPSNISASLNMECLEASLE